MTAPLLLPLVSIGAAVAVVMVLVWLAVHALERGASTTARIGAGRLESAFSVRAPAPSDEPPAEAVAAPLPAHGDAHR